MSEPEVMLDEIVDETRLSEPDCAIPWVTTDVAEELAIGESMTDNRVGVGLVKLRLENMTDVALEIPAARPKDVVNARVSEEREILAKLQTSS